MKLRQKATIRAAIILGMLTITSQAVKADEMPIFGLLSTLACQGAGDKTFPGFAISTFSFSDSVAPPPGGGAGGGGAGRVTFQDISVMKGLDDCTPLLFGAVAGGTHFKTASLSVVPKGSKVAVLLVELQDVSVTGDHFTEGVNKDVGEVITLSFTKIKITHVPSGKSFGWDVRANSPF